MVGFRQVGGLRIYVHVDEEPPPHITVYEGSPKYPGYKKYRFRIDTLVQFPEDYPKAPPGVRKKVRSWGASKLADLAEIWDDLQSGRGLRDRSWQ